MSCSPFDLRDYVLKELPDPERKQVEVHVKTCSTCREEVERWRLTEAALLSLRDEEIPQRIGFVSDKIFETSSWSRAWASFWNSGARLGFAAAAMLSTALIVFALVRPAPVTTVAAAISRADIDRQIQAAVDQASARNEAKFDQRIAELEQRNLKDRQELVRWADSLVDYSRRTEMVYRRAGYGPAGSISGGVQ
ncbi:MAG: zf-HC2 domain-containing protein [Acidobacteriia bacterium]|nr:zf-HC2 domain-containing protein [Terriglobia bacterium]